MSDCSEIGHKYRLELSDGMLIERCVNGCGDADVIDTDTHIECYIDQIKDLLTENRILKNKVRKFENDMKLKTHSQTCKKCKKDIVHPERKYKICLDCLIDVLLERGVGNYKDVFWYFTFYKEGYIEEQRKESPKIDNGLPTTEVHLYSREFPGQDKKYIIDVISNVHPSGQKRIIYIEKLPDACLNLKELESIIHPDTKFYIENKEVNKEKWFRRVKAPSGKQNGDD